MNAIGNGPAKIRRRATEPLEVFLRQIDAAHLEIRAHVANDIRQLKCESQAFREIGVARIVKAEDVQARKADGAGNAVAIFRELIESGVGADREVHLRTEN